MRDGANLFPDTICRWLLIIAVLFCAPLSSPVFCACEDCPAKHHDHSEHGHSGHGGIPCNMCQCDCGKTVALPNTEVPPMVIGGWNSAVAMLLPMERYVPSCSSTAAEPIRYVDLRLRV